MHPKVQKRFVKALKSSRLLKPAELQRALEIQRYAGEQGRELPLDRILLKLKLLNREQILGLWRALRYYIWRKEDKFYLKLAVQSKLITPDTAQICLKEQKKAYKHENELVRANEVARQRGYLNLHQDKALVRAMRQQLPELTLSAVEGKELEGYESRSRGAAPPEAGAEWRGEARQRDLESLKEHFDSSEELLTPSRADSLASGSLSSGSLTSGLLGFSDEDLDALWEEADLSDVELDSQAIEIARAPLFEDSDLDLDREWEDF